MNKEYNLPYWMFAVAAGLPGARHEFYYYADDVTVEHVVRLPDGYALAFLSGKYRYSVISARDNGEHIEYRLENPRPGKCPIRQNIRWVGHWTCIRLIAEQE